MEEIAEELRASLSGDVRDPYPLFAHLRTHQPITFAHQWGMDVYTVFRRADCDRVPRDPETFSNRIVHDTMGPAMGRTGAGSRVIGPARRMPGPRIPRRSR